MGEKPTIQTSSNLDRLPITVSSQCLREKTNFHMHDHVQLFYVLSGTVEHLLNKKYYTQNQGSCSIILPFVEHQIDLTASDDTPVVVFISFHDSFMLDRGYRFFPYGGEHARFEEHIIPEIREFSGKQEETATDLIRQIMAEFNRHKKMSYDKIAALLADFFRMLCIDTAKDCDLTLLSSRICGITNAIKHINKHYPEKLTIDDMCSIATMSRCMFTQHFKAITGKTFSQYLLAVRLQRSQNLLVTTELSLNEIAKRTGLNDKTHLAHMFVRHFGVPPMQYKKNRLPDTRQSEEAYKRRWEWLKNE